MGSTVPVLHRRELEALAEIKILTEVHMALETWNLDSNSGNPIHYTMWSPFLYYVNFYQAHVLIFRFKKYKIIVLKIL